MLYTIRTLLSELRAIEYLVLRYEDRLELKEWDEELKRLLLFKNIKENLELQLKGKRELEDLPIIELRKLASKYKLKNYTLMPKGLLIRRLRQEEKIRENKENE